MAIGGGALAAMAGAGSVKAAEDNPRPKPLVIAHRGCSAKRPEHTLAAYAKAIEDGADYIEPDLVCTKDGVLIIRHENEIGGTTDVAGRPEFASRKTTKTIDGHQQTGWFTEDFTLAELKTLRAIERLGAIRPESQSYDRQFPLVTMEEMIAFTAAEATARGRIIGLIPEIKHSTYFTKIGLPMEDRLLALLGAHDYTRRNPVEIQSFEVANLRYLRGKIGRSINIKLLQLLEGPSAIPADVAATGGRTTYGEMASPKGLATIATYADTVSPPTRMLIPVDATGKLTKPTSIAADARAAGLKLGTYTFRPENRFLPADYRNDAGDNARNEAGSIAEMRRYIALGLDSFFTDDPAVGRQAVDGSCVGTS